MPFGINVLRSQVLYQAAQAQGKPVTTAIPAEEPKGMQGQAKSLVLAENKCLKQESLHVSHCKKSKQSHLLKSQRSLLQCSMGFL